MVMRVHSETCRNILTVVHNGQMQFVEVKSFRLFVQERPAVRKLWKRYIFPYTHHEGVRWK